MALPTVQDFNTQFMANNPQYGYNGQPNPTSVASPSVDKNISQTGSQAIKWNPAALAQQQADLIRFGFANQELIDNQTLNALRPTNFNVSVPTAIDSDAFAPTNTIQNLNNTQKSDYETLRSYLTPTEDITKATKDLSDIRAEKARLQIQMRNELDQLEENPEGLFGGALRAEQQRIASKYERRLADIAIRENAAASTLKGYIDMQQQQYGMELDIAKLMQGDKIAGVTAKRAAQDDFMSMVDAFSGSPDLQTAIDEYNTSGTISPGLAPIIAQGQAAGYSPSESLSLIQYQTDKARQAEIKAALDLAKFEASSDKTTKSQNLTATINAVSAMGQSLVSQGVKVGSLEYAKGIAQATAASQTGLTSSEVANYSTMANIGSQLIALKQKIEEVGKLNKYKTIVESYAGKTVQSMTSPKVAELTAAINAIASPIARSLFGERGVLTDTDLKRVMSTMPDAKAPAIMDALYKELVRNVQTAAINKLSVDASTGRNVSGVVPYIEQLVNELGSAVTNTSGTTSSGITYKII